MTTEFTKNFRFVKPALRTGDWARAFTMNLDRIDALLAQVFADKSIPVQSAAVNVTSRGAWEHDCYYDRFDIAYSKDERLVGICQEAHTSSVNGSMRSEGEKWLFVVDIEGELGTVSADKVEFNPVGSQMKAKTAQEAIDELNNRLDRAAEIMKTLSDEIAKLKGV